MRQTTQNTAGVWPRAAWLGLVAGILLAISAELGGDAGLASGSGSERAPTHEPAPTSQANQAQGQLPERNKAIVELEKQIVGQENKPAEEVFKNIQMFKGQPAIRVLRVMEHGFSPALGVKCAFCHILGKWEKDDKKHKLVARKMMTLTQDINKEVKEMTDEKAAVNCYTCHRGDEKPALAPSSLPLKGRVREELGEPHKNFTLFGR